MSTVKPSATPTESSGWLRALRTSGEARRVTTGVLGPIIAETETAVGTHRVILRLTYPLTIAVVGFAVVSRFFGTTIPYWLIGVLGGLMLGVTAVEQRLVHRAWFAHILGGVHLCLSLLVLSVGVAFSGGVQSPFVWAYGLAMAVEGILRGRRWALAAAVASTFLLLATTLLVRGAVIPYDRILWSSRTTTSFYISYMGMFFSVAVTMSLLGEHLRWQMRQISDLADQIRNGYLGTIRALTDTIGAKDAYTAGHSRRVEQHAVEVSRHLGLRVQETEDLAIAAVLHDIGKIGISDVILQNTGKLAPVEMMEMRRHVEIGEAILARVPFLSNAARIVRHHHEWFDGTGYPDSLAGDAIPVGSRILCVVDAYEAMTSDRPYRRALPHWVAVTELRAGAGSQFDPQIVDVFLDMLARE